MIEKLEEIPDSELDEIEQRAVKAFAAAPTPWRPWLETRAGTGGCSVVLCGDDPDVDIEMYVDVHVGDHRLVSPDPGLDAIVDFVARAADDVPRLVAEIRRLRGQSWPFPSVTGRRFVGPDRRRGRRVVGVVVKYGAGADRRRDRPIVGRLRGTPPTEPVEAPPGLASLDTLVAQHTDTGLDVSVATSGTARTLAHPTDQALGGHPTDTVQPGEPNSQAGVGGGYGPDERP